MTLVAEWRDTSRPYAFASTVDQALSQRILGGAALACFASVCAFAICAQLGGGTSTNVTAPRGDRLVAARGDELLQAFAAELPAPRGDKLTLLPPAVSGAPAVTAASFDERFAGAARNVDLGAILLPPVDEAQAPSPAERHLAAHSETPAVPRGFAPRLRRGWHPDEAQADEQSAANPDDRPSIFKKLFGSSSSSIFAKLFGSSSSDVKLAYAAPEGAVAGDSGSITSGLFDRQTAVYDISAHMVYLPNGTKLEAHSGLGGLLDDPNSARVRSRGVTPPDIYDLKPREAMFHGVAALRLLPEDESKVFGRAGLLAHSYMLGPNGQSNGCVSFKDYDAFLKAYESHEITRLAVVARID
jgi:hypothetical protein